MGQGGEGRRGVVYDKIGGMSTKKWGDIEIAAKGKPSAVHSGGRSADQQEADLVDVAKLYLRGWKQIEILHWLVDNRDYAITQSQLSRDIQELHRRWLTAHVVDFDAAKAKELERIDVLERAYWEGYERSMAERVEDSVEEVRDEQRGSPTGKVADGEEGEERVSVADGEASHIYTRSKRNRKVVQRDGSVAYLQGVERCIGLRSGILGLNAPQQLNISWRKDARLAGVDPDELKRNLIRQYVGKAKQSLAEAVRLQTEVEEERDSVVIDGEARDVAGEEHEADGS